MTDEQKNETEGVTADRDPVSLDKDPAEEATSPAEEVATPTDEACPEREAEQKDPPPEEPVQYAFHWDYRSQNEADRRADRTVRVHAGLFYGLIVGAIFAVMLLLLTVVLLVGNGMPKIFGSGTVSGLTERVVYVNGDGDAEEELACEAAIAKMLPSTVSIIVSTGTGSGVGSGIVLSEDGYIATNHHVVDGKTSLTVRLYGGERYEATLVGSDARSDLAVLKIDATGLTPATFGDSSKLLVGETVMAIGTPTGISYSETVTRGIVSCAARGVKVYNASGTLDHTLLMVQTDASVNPGNSGGPLIDRKGEVVGIIANKTVFYENGSAYFADGMGLAIPSSAAKGILDALIRGEEPDRSGFLIKAARLGIGGKNVVAGDEYDVTGVAVTQINGAGFDAANKLIVGDVITELEGVEIKSVGKVVEILENYIPGATVHVKFYRSGVEMSADIILGSDDLSSVN